MTSGSNTNRAEPRYVPPALAEKPAGLPPGKYMLVGWEIVTTGRRLIDEICQIAAYISPATEYSQFVMPFGEMNPGARRRNDMRIVTIGRFRMLKDMSKQTMLKTKPEVAAMADFLNWLEENKSPDEKVILMYHEPHRLHPKMILESMIRHQLLPRFRRIVAGFTDSYSLCNEKCLGTVRSISLRILSTMLLEEGNKSVATALDRAKATYNIIDQLSNEGVNLADLEAGIKVQIRPSKDMMDLALEFARPVSTELLDLESMHSLLERQNTFRPVMKPLMRGSRQRRRRLTYLRSILAEAGLMYYQFKDAWHMGQRAGMERLMSPLEETVKPEDIQELLDIFEAHFDPPTGSRHQLPDTEPDAEDGEQPTEELEFSSDSDASGPLLYFFGLANISTSDQSGDQSVLLEDE